MAEENTSVETTTEAPAPVAEQPTIGLADLQNAVKVIDYAAEQGAFKGWAVIEQVIAVRNKLNSFVLAAAPKEEPAAEVPAAPEAKAKKATKATKPVKAATKAATAPAKAARVVKTVKKA